MAATALAAAMVLAAAIAASPAAAQGAALRTRARQMSDEAAKLFVEKRFVEAAEKIEQAYALDPSVRLRLRNAGRAWEEAGEPARALHCFERFLALETDPALRKDTEERIERLRQAIAAKEAAARAAQVPQAAATAPQTLAPQPAVVAPNAPTLGRSPLALAIGGGGLALLASGVAWHLRTASAAADVDTADDKGQYAYPGGASKRDDDRATLASNRVVSWSLVGAGALATGAGVWFFIRRPAAAAATVSATVAPTAGGASVALAGRF